MRFGLFGEQLDIWPPTVGLLHPLLELVVRPRSQWSADDWRTYAEHLERAGYKLAESIQRERALRFATQARLSRKKRREPAREVPAYPPGLLAGALSNLSRTKRGRPIGSKAEETAREALAMQARMMAELGSKVTALDAISEVRRLRGQRTYRPRENRSIMNAMSRLRNHKKHDR